MGGRRQGEGWHGSSLLPTHTEAGIYPQGIQLRTAWPVHSLVALSLLSQPEMPEWGCPGPWGGWELDLIRSSKPSHPSGAQ